VEQGLCTGRIFVYSSVPSIDSSSSVQLVCCWVPCRQEMWVPVPCTSCQSGMSPLSCVPAWHVSFCSSVAILYSLTLLYCITLLACMYSDQLITHHNLRCRRPGTHCRAFRLEQLLSSKFHWYDYCCILSYCVFFVILDLFVISDLLSVWSDVQTCIWPSWCHCHPLSFSCFSKSTQIGFTFLVPAHLGSPGKGLLNGCVYVCVCIFCNV